MASKKSKYASIVTYEPSDEVRFEKLSDKRLTVEGETYTIQELFARNANKHNPSRESNVYYEDTEDFDSFDFSKLRSMDLFDRHELYTTVQEKARSAREKIEEHLKEIEAKKTQESAERSVEAKSEAPKAEESKGSEKAPENT